MTQGQELYTAEGLGCSTKCENTPQHTFYCILINTRVTKWSPYNRCHGLRTAGLYKEDACTIASMYIKVWFSFKETTLRKHLNNQCYISSCTLPMQVYRHSAVSSSSLWHCWFKYIIHSDFHHSRNVLGYLGYQASPLHIAKLLCLTFWHNF